MKKYRDRRFTLVEVVVIVVVAGTLATVAVFIGRGIVDRIDADACNAQAQTLDSAIDAYYVENRQNPGYTNEPLADRARGVPPAVLADGYLPDPVDEQAFRFAEASSGRNATFVGVGRCFGF